MAYALWFGFVIDWCSVFVYLFSLCGRLLLVIGASDDYLVGCLLCKFVALWFVVGC